MHTLKGAALEGCGEGLVRLCGSFTTNSSGTVIGLTSTSYPITPTYPGSGGVNSQGPRPSHGNIKFSRVAAGVYVIDWRQTALSIVSADARAVLAQNFATVGTTALPTALPGTAMIVGDFMVPPTPYSAVLTADKTHHKYTILVQSGGSLVDVYTLGNHNSIADYRISFDITVATSTMNY